jgi:hypothetical protein
VKRGSKLILYYPYCKLHVPEVSIVTVSPASKVPFSEVIESEVVSMRSNLEPHPICLECEGENKRTVSLQLYILWR